MSLLINKAIYTILSGSSSVTNIVQDKLFPIVGDDDVKNPFLVYERKSIQPNYTKDGLSYDECVIEITCVSDNYSEVIELADAVRKAIELKTGIISGVAFFSSVLIGSSENYGIDNYIQTLIFKIKSK
jgi:hypothetical protein